MMVGDNIYRVLTSPDAVVTVYKVSSGQDVFMATEPVYTIEATNASAAWSDSKVSIRKEQEYVYVTSKTYVVIDLKQPRKH